MCFLPRSFCRKIKFVIAPTSEKYYILNFVCCKNTSVTMKQWTWQHPALGNYEGNEWNQCRKENLTRDDDSERTAQDKWLKRKDHNVLRRPDRSPDIGVIEIRWLNLTGLFARSARSLGAEWSWWDSQLNKASQSYECLWTQYYCHSAQDIHNCDASTNPACGCFIVSLSFGMCFP